MKPEHPAPQFRCPRCLGSGRVAAKWRLIGWLTLRKRPCPVCGGEGMVAPDSPTRKEPQNGYPTTGHDARRV
jgi:DnaJ-class molecular chaperone